MSRPTKSLDVVDRLGVYETLDDVPNRYRLHHHADRYAGEGTWQEFCDEKEYEAASHARHEQAVDTVGERWKAHMEERERHHALATPEDVEEWCVALLDEKSKRRAHDHWLRVRRFYDWLQWDVRHPHRYHPVLMAAVEGEAAGQIWQYKARQNRQRRERYQSRGDA